MAAIRQEAGLFCGSFLRKGEVLAFARSIQNLKDLKENLKDLKRDWYCIAEQPAPAPHLARPEGRAALTHVC